MVADWFGPDGRLRTRLAGFSPREAQTQLAQAIEATIADQGRLVAEAGTGVGKTYAYLVPALDSGLKVMVSTASRTLQDQLYERDLPRLCEAMGLSHVRRVRLKGRSNYLCPYRLERTQKEGRLTSAQEAADLREVVRFAALSSDGDIAGCTSVSEQSGIWSQVTSTAENCLGQTCPKWSECPVVRAREAASQAEVLIVNHHLLCADFAMRQAGEGDLLPSAAVVILDEAHAIPEIAGQFFGRSLSSQGLAVFGRELLAAGLMHARDAADWAGLTGQLEGAALNFRASLGSAAETSRGSSPNRQTRQSWADLEAGRRQMLLETVGAVDAALQAIAAPLTLAAERHTELQRLGERVEDLRAEIPRLLPPELPGALDGVYWIEQSRQTLSLHWAPIEVSSLLQSAFEAEPIRSWIFVSATLAVPSQSEEGSFGYYCQRAGIRPTQCLALGSPFDYADQSLLVVPDNLPDPKSPGLVLALLEMPGLMGLIDKTPGGVFILCTSLRAVDQAGQYLTSQASPLSPRRILVQGQAPRAALLETFRADGRAILVGSASFWEGVDVPGSALSLVIIDKLPFAPPDDPVLEARMAECRAAGGDPFREIQLPEATLALKQGAGRLIRTETDRGILLVGDRRLAETPYGRRMLRALPPFPRTRSLEAAHDFFPDAADGRA